MPETDSSTAIQCLHFLSMLHFRCDCNALAEKAKKAKTTTTTAKPANNKSVEGIEEYARDWLWISVTDVSYRSRSGYQISVTKALVTVSIVFQIYVADPYRG